MGISWESHGIFMGYQKMEDWWLICSCFCPTGVAKKTIQKNIHKHHGMWLVIPHFWTTSGSHFSVDPLLSHTEIGYIGHLSVPKKTGIRLDNSILNCFPIFLVEYAKNPPVCPPMLYTSMANWSSQQQTIPKFDGLMGGTNQPHLEVYLYLVYHITSHITKKTYQYPFISRMASHQS